MKNLTKYYQKNYYKYGYKFQREYPNEEFVRFVSRNYCLYTKKQKKKIKILETGSGSGGNLWAIAEQGFDSYGIDISKNSIVLAKKKLKKKKLKANIISANMLKLPFKKNYFDAIVDIFSSCHLNSVEGNQYLLECFDKLKKNGLFFSYFPSKKSKMFSNKKNIFLDKNTLYNNTKIKTVYKISNFPFRFLSKKDYCDLLSKNGFKIKYSEELTKTYSNGKDYFTFNVIEAKKSQ